jgi:hypothetical protein
MASNIGDKGRIYGSKNMDTFTLNERGKLNDAPT